MSQNRIRHSILALVKSYRSQVAFVFCVASLTALGLGPVRKRLSTLMVGKHSGPEASCSILAGLA